MAQTKLGKINQVLLFSAIIIVALYFGASLLIPFTFAVLFATLVLPLSNLVERKLRFGRIASSFLSTFLIFIAVGLLMFMLIDQVVVFVNDVVGRKDEILTMLQGLQEGIAESTGFQMEQQEQMLKERLSDIMNTAQKFISTLLSDLTTMLVHFLLMLIYVFLLLLNRQKMVDFVMMYTPEGKKEKTQSIIHKTRSVAHSYLWGRIQVMIILGIMYIIVFLAYGLEHTMLLVIFGTIITIIPYIGPFVSGLLPILFMFLYDHSTPAVISFIILIVVIQLIESYVMEPVLIGKEVQQNPLFVIIAVILGGALWGPAGLILFVPLFSILKIVFDHMEQLQPVGFLMGYDEDEEDKESLTDKIKRMLGI